jgi:2-octaprenyl-6-methoxyphenol hydroxylase
MTDNNRILISGGGVAGLTAAALFGSNGFRVTCVDPAPPITEREATGADLRSTAFLQPSVHVLERAGVWHAMAEHATPLQTMRIVDATAEGARKTRISMPLTSRSYHSAGTCPIG